MQNDARKQELIKAKLKELEALEATLDPRNLYEEDPDEPIEQQPQEPQEKFYDADQLIVAMWCETINSILQEVPMSRYKQIRLVSVRNRLLYEMDLQELIPPPEMVQPTAVVQEPEQQQEQQEQPQQAQQQPSEIPDVADPNYRDPTGDKDLEIISKKLKDIDSKEGLLEPKPEPEPEATGIKKLLGGFGSKKKPAERNVSDEHQPMSMG